MTDLAKEIVASKRLLASSMSGIGIAILTFTIQFFFGQVTNNEVSRIVFTLILITIILSIFCFAFAVLFYQNALEIYVMRGETIQVEKDNNKGDLFFLVAFFSLLAEPAIILWAIEFFLVSLLSLIFWVGLVCFVVIRRRK